MQDSKIKRMSIKDLEIWLDAIDELLSHYLRIKSLESAYCPLCFVHDCEDCLWIIIEEKHCEDLVEELYPGRHGLGASGVRENLRFKKWKLIRIKQLTSWRAVISGELASRHVKEKKEKK